METGPDTAVTEVLDAVVTELFDDDDVAAAPPDWAAIRGLSSDCWMIFTRTIMKRIQRFTSKQWNHINIKNRFEIILTI